MGIKGIYIGVCLECEELVFPKQSGLTTWPRDLQATKRCTRVKHVEKLNRRASCSTTRQKVQTGHSVSSRLGLVTQSSREAKLPVYSVMKKWVFAFLSHSSINTPYTHKILRASRENFERKPQRKTRLTHPQSLHSDSSNSSTLIISIVTSLRGTLVKTFSHHIHICENAIWYLESS